MLRLYFIGWKRLLQLDKDRLWMPCQGWYPFCLIAAAWLGPEEYFNGITNAYLYGWGSPEYRAKDGTELSGCYGIIAES